MIMSVFLFRTLELKTGVSIANAFGVLKSPGPGFGNVCSGGDLLYRWMLIAIVGLSCSTGNMDWGDHSTKRRSYKLSVNWFDRALNQWCGS